MLEMLMWPTNTTAVAAEEFRSEESSSLGTTLDLHSASIGGRHFKLSEDAKTACFEISQTKMLTFMTCKPDRLTHQLPFLFTSTGDITSNTGYLSFLRKTHDQY